MKIALLGYGRMGKAIEKIAHARGHDIVCKIDKGYSEGSLNQANVAINFSVPNAAVNNISLALKSSIPVICGTTGWLDDYDNLENVMPSQAYRNYQRNKKVIDLEEIPQEVKTKILDKYNSLKPTPNMKALNYLIVNRMNNLVESVGDFHRK